MGEDVTEALARIFSVDSELYEGRGFMHRVGFGERQSLERVLGYLEALGSGQPVRAAATDAP